MSAKLVQMPPVPGRRPAVRRTTRSSCARCP